MKVNSVQFSSHIWKVKMKVKLEKYFIETKKVPSFTFFSAYQFSRTTNQPKSQTLN